MEENVDVVRLIFQECVQRTVVEMVDVPVSQLQERCHHCIVERFVELSVLHVVEGTMEENDEVVRLTPQVRFHCTVEEMLETANSAGDLRRFDMVWVRRGGLSTWTAGLPRRPRCSR